VVKGERLLCAKGCRGFTLSNSPHAPPLRLRHVTSVFKNSYEHQWREVVYAQGFENHMSTSALHFRCCPIDGGRVSPIKLNIIPGVHTAMHGIITPSGTCNRLTVGIQFLFRFHPNARKVFNVRVYGNCDNSPQVDQPKQHKCAG
jgi:hypothetical protein